MSTYRLFRLLPEDPSQGELIVAHERERDMARYVFRTWPIAACLPFVQKDGEYAGAQVLTIWETAADAKAKRKPIAVVRTQPPTVQFTRELWNTPVSA